MIKISERQYITRYRTLPQNLKDAIASEDDAEQISVIGEQNHLSPEKTSAMAKTLGYILAGFVLPDDLAKELEGGLHLNHTMAVELAKILDQKFIAPFRADIDKVYKPLGPEDFNLIPDRRSENRNPMPKPVLMKESPGPAILHQEDAAVPRPAAIPRPSTGIPKPSMPVPKPEAKMPLPGTMKSTAPMRPQVLSPFGFQKEARPLNTPAEFKLGGIPRPNISNISNVKAAPRVARVEMGKEESKSIPKPESKVVGREPVHYTEPKSAFMPGMVKNGVPIPKKPDLPLPSYPKPIS